MAQFVPSYAAMRRAFFPAVVVSATAAATLVGCGGGGGSDNGALAAFALANAPAASPAPAPAPAPVAPTPSAGDDPAQDLSSTPCVNEADYHEGTVIAFSAATTAPVNGGAPFQRRTVTGARESFANANPVPFALDPKVDMQTLPPAYGVTYTSTTTNNRKDYRDIVAGQVIIYGDAQTSETVLSSTAPSSAPTWSRTTTTQVFNPALSFPITMQPGATVSQQTTRTEVTTYDAMSSLFPMPPSSTGAAGLFSLTYQGRERITTPVGTFDTCRFTYQLTTSRSGTSVQTTQDQWIAAEGPYRGQLLRMKKNGAVWDVNTLTYSPA